MKRPIGIFDSGLGGLTVFSRNKEDPSERRHDLFRRYRPCALRLEVQRSSNKIFFQIAEFLIRQKVKMIVVACNTASAFALPALKKSSSYPIFGVVYPGAKAAFKSSKKNRIGVIGTEGTIKSASYERQYTL